MAFLKSDHTAIKIKYLTTLKKIDLLTTFFWTLVIFKQKFPFGKKSNIKLKIQIIKYFENLFE